MGAAPTASARPSAFCLTVKEPNLAPAFCCIYPGLCDIARKLGYALTIHGTVSRDLDLVAIPWTNDAVGPQELVDRLLGHLNACIYSDLIELTHARFTTERQRAQIVDSQKGWVPEMKPHKRLAWNLHMDFGAKVDLSIMPRHITPADGEPEWMI